MYGTVYNNNYSPPRPHLVVHRQRSRPNTHNRTVRRSVKLDQSTRTPEQAVLLCLTPHKSNVHGRCTSHQVVRVLTFASGNGSGTVSGAAPISWLLYIATDALRPVSDTATLGATCVDVTDSRRFLRWKNTAAGR